MTDEITIGWTSTEGTASVNEDKVLEDIKALMLKHKLLNINVSIPKSVYEEE